MDPKEVVEEEAREGMVILMEEVEAMVTIMRIHMEEEMVI